MKGCFIEYFKEKKSKITLTGQKEVIKIEENEEYEEQEDKEIDKNENELEEENEQEVDQEDIQEEENENELEEEKEQEVEQKDIQEENEEEEKEDIITIIEDKEYSIKKGKRKELKGK